MSYEQRLARGFARVMRGIEQKLNRIQKTFDRVGGPHINRQIAVPRTVRDRNLRVDRRIEIDAHHIHARRHLVTGHQL